MIKSNPQIRNIAIIAHVDHGKTTLVDAMLCQSGTVSQASGRVMDSGAQEKERGITISAKNCAIGWEGVRINIIDTPGHSDFSGEVERGLSMVDGVILLVDAAEGPLPQTRFVLTKAFEQNLTPIVVINKVDRHDAQSAVVLQDVYELLLELSGDERMLEVPVFYAIGKEGRCGLDPSDLKDDLRLLLDAIIEMIPAPMYDDAQPFQMLVSDLSYSEYLGRLAVGRVVNGSASVHDSLICIQEGGTIVPLRVTKLQTYDGPRFVEAHHVQSGEIVVLSGVEAVAIGDTICTAENPKALARIKIDEPTVAMHFSKNISPLAGREGSAVTSARIGERLVREALRNVSIRVEKNKDDSYTVKGRGEFQMAIIIEEMRREGFELCVGRPKIIMGRDEQGAITEPIEVLAVDVPEQYGGTVMEQLARRKAVMRDITYTESGRMKMQFEIPSRGLIGYRDEFLTESRGLGVMNSYLKGYEPYKGEIEGRQSGSLISDRSGNAVAYALWQLEDRGRLFVVPGDPVYEGQVVGEHNRAEDLLLNPTRTKKLTNLRAAGKDDAVSLTPITKMGLEQAIRFIKDDELVEVTPLSIRLCKRILDSAQRHVYEKRGEIPSYLFK
ncbi:MAG: translational GTPase TypA [Sphaerochaeta sp.]|jgi:GTP-binding protein|nr:translational GTPase TypA [Sphaerochaeta sp.]